MYPFLIGIDIFPQFLLAEFHQHYFPIEELFRLQTHGALSVKKVKQSCYKPRGFQEVKVPRFHDKGTGWW